MRPLDAILVVVGFSILGFIVCLRIYMARNAYVANDDDFHGETVIEEEVVIDDTPSGNITAYPDGYQPGDAPPSRPPGF